MVNGKAAGETSLVIWLSDGSRREYDVDVEIAGREFRPREIRSPRIRAGAS